MIVVVLAGVIPVLIGLLAPVWFGQFVPAVRRVRKAARILDAKDVALPTTIPCTVKTLREHQKCGDMIVIVHHLAKWHKDLQRKILTALCFNGAATLVLVVVFAVKTDQSMQNPNAGWAQLLHAMSTNWPFSILFAASLLEILIVIKLVAEQSAKYSDILESTNDPPGSVRAFLTSIVGKVARVQPSDRAAAAAGAGTRLHRGRAGEAGAGIVNDPDVTRQLRKEDGSGTSTSASSGKDTTKGSVTGT